MHQETVMNELNGIFGLLAEDGQNVGGFNSSGGGLLRLLPQSNYSQAIHRLLSLLASLEREGMTDKLSTAVGQSIDKYGVACTIADIQGVFRHRGEAANDSDMLLIACLLDQVNECTVHD